MLKRVVKIIPGTTVDKKQAKTERLPLQATNICPALGGISNQSGAEQHTMAAAFCIG